VIPRRSHFALLAVVALTPTAHLGCVTGQAAQPCPTGLSSGQVGAPGERLREAMHFEVLELATWFDGTAPTVEEEATLVRIQAPEFQARAVVRCDNQVGPGWSVGFIQAVTGRDQANEYPDVKTIWELRPLPINDSDGTYPWYSASARVNDCRGRAVVSFSDAPATSVAWIESRPAEARQTPAPGRLIRHRRWQGFRVWLVALHVPTDRMIVLKEFDWEFEQNASFDATRPIGSRLLDRSAKLPPVTVRDWPDASPVPEQVTRPPRANDADTLWWIPNDPAIGMRSRIRAPQWGPR